MPNWATTSQFSIVLNRFTDLMSVIPSAKIRQYLYVIIGVWFLSMAADVFWLLIPSPVVLNVSSTSFQQDPTAQIATLQNRVRINIQEMQEWYLFGGGAQSISAEPVPEASLNPEDAAISSLQLTVLGIMYSTEPDQGFAVLDNQGSSALYKVGQEIPVGGRVTLAKVLVDRVIIDNNGKQEAIMMYSDKDKAAIVQQSVGPRDGANPRVVDQRQNPHLSSMANTYRNQLLSNPLSFSDIINVSVAKDADGSLLGYRIRPGRDRQQFTDFGLMTGDIVTAINGVKLDDPQKAMELYGQLREATEASFVVKRGAEEINLIIALAQQ